MIWNGISQSSTFDIDSGDDELIITCPFDRNVVFVEITNEDVSGVESVVVYANAYSGIDNDIILYYNSGTSSAFTTDGRAVGPGNIFPSGTQIRGSSVAEENFQGRVVVMSIPDNL